MTSRWALGALLFSAVACATSQSTQQEDEQALILAMAAAARPPELPPPTDVPGQQQVALVAGANGALPAARIDGKPISGDALAAHQRATGLPRAEAVTDLVDLTLLREAAGKRGIVLPAGPVTPEAREDAERKLAAAMNLDLPPDTVSLVVDHAWVKNATTPTGRAAQKKAIYQLHALAVAGETIPAAFPKLAGKVTGKVTGMKAADWHIGDHEEYPVSVIPAGVRELAAGTVSAVEPGDGGLHLFKIHERKTTPPAASIVHEAVRQQLLEGLIIEVIQLPGS